MAGMLNSRDRTIDKGEAMEALGIFFAAFTLGMLGLWIAVVQIEKSETDATPRSSAETLEVKKAA